MADVVIDKEPGGRPSGEAFVRLANKQHAEMALERNKNNMGARYGNTTIQKIMDFCLKMTAHI